MKNFYLAIILSFCFFGVKGQSDTSVYRSAAIEVQKKYAPDKRSVYFNMHIRGDSVRLESTSETALLEFEKVKPTMQNIKFASVLLPAKSLNGLVYGVTNISVGNNRSNPVHGAELMTQMLLGTPVEIFKKQGGFYLVKTPDGYFAWTDGGALTAMNEQTFKDWQKADKIIFIADYGHAFSKADVNSIRVSDLVSGNILQVLGEENSFYKVSFPDKRIAFIPKAQAGVYKQWLKKPNPNATAVLATAQTLLGVPYLWGGTSIKGVDCSGFTKTAYFLNGIIIPRDASQQALVGDVVDVLEHDTISVAKCLANLQPGDLLFFSAAKRRGINGGKVTHTAIYMGNGEFIQSAGMVKINSLVPTATNYDGGQASTLVGARRILTAIGKPEITRVDHHEWYGKN
ncbi:SH3 domain-containing protein [Pedobacter sp. LMG 31464]|uniref:SH3 domain-containing protein n=1 Tax=Pedobacter planticolens TaxID=2679964 RepID=A0A923DW84_9SPHI|nr:C40 family peptidase [Pedobacter planticolens]MBB2144206.1 SH3 domain-containing protein [Pedobacter planticolens]